MKTKYLLPIPFFLFVFHIAFSQKASTKPRRVAPVMTAAEHRFVQEAINSNNEAMALAQMALQQSGKSEVQQIAGQLLNDHRAAQQKLYGMAQLKDTMPYTRYYNPEAMSSKLPLTDNLNSRRNNAIASISTSSTTGASGMVANNTSNTTSNTPVATTATTTQGANPYTGVSYSTINQTYNGNTSIDNAVGNNNNNRTDIGGYSGRWTENTTVINNQPLNVSAQPAVNPVTAPSFPNNTGNSVAATSTGINVNTNSVENTPNFPNRLIDTVRMTGANVNFQNPGTNLSFPGNERYTNTTPNTRPNSNAGSDYGYTGIAINNGQTNASNTAAYSNNEINGNIVQTGQLQGQANPAAVINSSTASMTNNQVAINNADANRANQIAAQARRNGIVVTGNTGNPPVNTSVVTNGIDADTTSATPILVGRAGNRSIAAQPAGNAANTFYTLPFSGSNALSALQNTSAENFNKEWTNQMLTNQQVAIQKYQAALKTTHLPQLRVYINTILPLLQGHQYALQQWQAKQ